jgi:hypothetical protein
VVWQDHRGATQDIYGQRVSPAGAIQWTPNGVVICGEAGDQRFPVVVSDGAGGTVVCWEDERSGVSDIYAQRVDTQGVAQWASHGVPLCSAPSEQLMPRMIAAPSHGAIVTWDDYRDYNADVYAQQVNGAGSVLWAANGVAVCSDPGEQYGAGPVTDGAGGVIIPWNDFRNASGDIFLQRILGAGAVASGWPVNGKAACTVSGNQFDPVAVSDDAGGILLSWDDYRDGQSSYQIYAQHLNASGAVMEGWQSQGQLVCGAANDQLQPTIASDLAGGAVISWYDYRSGAADIYAYRIPSSGMTVGVPAGQDPGLDRLQVFPNPMRSLATIQFGLPRRARVSLEVVELAGRRVRVLARDERREPGMHSMTWDGRDAAGRPVPGGVYLLVLRADSAATVRKLARME